MPESKFAVVTAFPRSPLLSGLFMAGLLDLFVEYANNGMMGIAAHEPYVRLGDTSSLNNITFSGMNRARIRDYINSSWEKHDHGSSWVISCPLEHEFHQHDISPEYMQVQQRKLLIVSDQGMDADIFAVNKDGGKAISPLEKYIVPPNVLIELAFDGNLAHRFIPHGQGKIIAYSAHPQDLDKGLNALGVHTQAALKIEIPKEVITINVYAKEFDREILKEALRVADPQAIKAEITNIEDILQELQSEEQVDSTKWISRLVSDDKIPKDPNDKGAGFATAASK